jgi:hypothetical protein
MTDNQLSSVLDKLGAVKDTMTVSRRELPGRWGHHRPGCHRARRRRGWRWRGNPTRRGRQGTGAGLGFGVIVRPLGVYVIKNGEVSWQPAIDVLRVVVGGQVLALATILAFRRRRKRR